MWYQWSVPRSCTVDSHVFRSSNPPVILRGSKNAKFNFVFRPEWPLRLSGFEKQQRIRNLHLYTVAQKKLHHIISAITLSKRFTVK